jgi:hypothetical protein
MYDSIADSPYIEWNTQKIVGKRVLKFREVTSKLSRKQPQNPEIVSKKRRRPIDK